MSTLTQFYLNSATSVKELDCLEISHPNFSKTYYIVRNLPAGGNFTHEDATVHAYQYYPLKISGIAADQTLDQVLSVQLGDLGTILPQELDAIAAAGTFDTRPVVKYRTYASSDLTVPLTGPYVMEIINMPFNSEGVAFEATAPTINNNKTGEIYSLERFPMLRGFLV